MSIIFSNVNLVKIGFINNKFDLHFEFIDSCIDSLKYIGEIICQNVYSFKLNIDPSEELQLPAFFCDVITETVDLNEDKYKKFNDFNFITSNTNELTSNESYLVRFEGGEADITIICQNINIVKK